MIKHLTKHGNSLALVIDKPILDLLGIRARTPISITTDGKSLFLRPVKDPKSKKDLNTTLEEINRDFGPSLRRLA